jgi:SAM-dependent methyltransferase
VTALEFLGDEHLDVEVVDGSQTGRREVGRMWFVSSSQYPRLALGRSLLAERCSLAVMAVNVEQAEAWNGASGRHFIEQRERHERMRGGLTARLLAAAQTQDGDNVLDIGCGCGDTTILAARATPSGHALGADLSRIQVEQARRLAAAAGVANARF